MISITGLTRKQYSISIDVGTYATGAISVDRMTVSIKPYGTNETIVIQEQAQSEGSLTQYPEASL